jgi:superfamily II DNA/RNA helicase
MNSFAELGVRPALVDALTREGITEPFPIQSLVVADALAGRHVCGKANTGSGKTLAFAIPLAQRIERATDGHPRGLVLVPTRELAAQVLDVLRPLAQASKLRVAAIYGGASFDRQTAAARKGLDIVVATPGRLIDLIERKLIALDRVEMAVVDEADRMADMGFLPQVEWVLRQFRARKPQVLLFSATLDRGVDSLVRSYLRDPVHHEAEAEGPQVEDLVHRFLAVHRMDRVRVAAAICRSSTRVLLFVRTKRGADRLTAQLQKEGVRTGAIHGDLRQGARQRALADFAAGKLRALVATDVAARGIHVEEVDVVIHFDPPEDHKAYIHRSGRTARAGRTGTVATFVLWDQVVDVQRIQKRLGLDEPVVEVFSNDPRLADLPSLSPSLSIAG